MVRRSRPTVLCCLAALLAQGCTHPLTDFHPSGPEIKLANKRLYRAGDTIRFLACTESNGAPQALWRDGLGNARQVVHPAENGTASPFPSEHPRLSPTCKWWADFRILEPITEVNSLQASGAQAEFRCIPVYPERYH